MNAEQVRIQFIGLADPDADLTVLGHCDECGAELWRRTYRPQDFAGLSSEAILIQVKNDTQRDHLRAARHECAIH